MQVKAGRGNTKNITAIVEPQEEIIEEEAIRDGNGLLQTKDGFYLRESDDESDGEEILLSKKQRKKMRRRMRQMNGEGDYESDSSTEDVLCNVRAAATAAARRPGQQATTTPAGQNTTSEKGAKPFKAEPKRAKAQLEREDLSMGLSNTVNNSLKRTE